MFHIKIFLRPPKVLSIYVCHMFAKMRNTVVLKIVAVWFFSLFVMQQCNDSRSAIVCPIDIPPCIIKKMLRNIKIQVGKSFYKL